MSPPAERREVQAVVRGDWTMCGGCNTRIALGVLAVRLGARLKCFRCGSWVVLPVMYADETMGGGDDTRHESPNQRSSVTSIRR